MMKTPLIFIHKSNIKDSQEYLYDTFRVAKKYNPDMDIYLLGDGNNKHYADKVGIKFEYYDDYSGGEESEKFEKVFQVIKGPHHGSEEWIKFVFKRWFYIYNFIKSKSFDRFWTFDSDNLIISRLHDNEYKFEGYDCTEQCSGACINGLVNNVSVVKGYLDKINELFEDDFYVARQINEFNTINPTYAFTEMRAYAEYKKRYSTAGGKMDIYSPRDFKSILLQEIIDGETFDQSLSQPDEKILCGEERNSGFEMQNGIKKIYLQDGKIYQKFVDTGELARVNAINMSWVDHRIWKSIVKYVIGDEEQ